MSLNPPKSALRSCLYECRVLHERLIPRHHRFMYGAFWFYLDLDELPLLQGSVRAFGISGRHPYRFVESDHLVFGEHHQGSMSLADRVRWWLSTQDMAIPGDARISLLTLPRFLGYVFNPVSFFFVESREGKPLVALAEVGNTFGEQKLYGIPLESSEKSLAGGRFRRVVPKHFYVSPFSPLDLSFDFRLRMPGTTLALAVDDRASDGKRCLLTRLTGVKKALNDAELARLTLRYPWVTLRVIFLIHWEAFRLWLKRVPWFGKTDRPDLQRDVLRAHASLASPVVPSRPIP